VNIEQSIELIGLGISTRASRDKSRVVGDSEVIQLGIVRISPEKSASRQEIKR